MHYPTAFRDPQILAEPDSHGQWQYPDWSVTAQDWEDSGRESDETLTVINNSFEAMSV